MSNKLSLVVNFLGIDKMSEAIRNITGATKNGSKSIRELNADARKLKGEMKDVAREFGRTNGNVTQLIDRERDLERALAGVNRQLERQKRVATIDSRRNATVQRSSDMKSSGASNVVSGGFQLVAVGAALKGAVDYDGVMADIGIKLGINERETKKLSGQILLAAMNSKQLPTTMQAAADKLASIGASAKDIPDMLGPIGKVATAYNALPDDLAGAAAASIQNLGLKSTDTAKALALMAVAGKDGKFEIKDMANQFPMLAASAGALKQKGLSAVADLSAASQIAAQGVGNDMSVAGNNINNLLLKINSRETVGNFKKFGVDLPKALHKAYQDGKTPIEAIAELTNKTLGGNLEKISSLFGDQQAQAALLQLVPKLAEYRALRASIQTRTGEVAKDYERKAGTAQAGVGALLGNLQVLAITLGSTVLPDLVTFSGYLVVAAQNVNSFAQAHPTLIRYMIMAAAGSATLRVGIGALRFAFGGILGPAAKLWSVWSKYRALGSLAAVFPKTAMVLSSAGSIIVRTFGIMRVAAMFLARGIMQAGLMMLANPIVLAITAIVLAIGVAAYLIYSHWSTIKGAFATGVAWVKSSLAALPQWLSRIGSNMMQGLLMALDPALLVARLLSVARTGIAAFKNFFGIKSPSRLFMEMGGHMTSGLAMGIDRGAPRPHASLGRLMNGMVPGPGGVRPTIETRLRGAQAIRPMSAAARNSRAAAGPLTIHVHGAPGQDVRALAKAVVRELDTAYGVKARRSYEGDR